MVCTITRDLLAALEGLPLLPNTFHPWRDANPDDAPANGPMTRQEHLAAHFAGPDVDLILCGEAVGHVGAKYSGIAFTSEGLLMDGAIPRIAKTPRLSLRPKPLREMSARAVWKTLYAHGVHDRTRLWNAFPLHPFRPGDPLSNRTPTSAELRTGLPALEILRDAFPAAQFVAVGLSAHRSLTSLGISHETVRHPAYGGETEFSEGIARIVAARFKASGSRG